MTLMYEVMSDVANHHEYLPKKDKEKKEAHIKTLHLSIQ